MKKSISIPLLAVFLLTIAIACAPAAVKVDDPYGALPDSCQVEAFLSNKCAYCKRMEEYLIAKNIPYLKRDVTDDYWARQDYYAYGGTGVPLLRIGKTFITGYKPEEVDQAFRSYCKTK